VLIGELPTSRREQPKLLIVVIDRTTMGEGGVKMEMPEVKMCSTISGY
jgi:hypothetical protein